MLEDEVREGMQILQKTLVAAKMGFLSPPQFLSKREVVRVVISANVDIDGQMLYRGRNVEFSYEFLSDLPGTPEYQKALETHLKSLAYRLRNPRPSEHVTLSGIPVDVEIEWPFSRARDGRDALFVWASCKLIPAENREAKLTVNITRTLQVIAVPSFVEVITESLVMNAARKAIDAGSVKFYEAGKHPQELQRVTLSTADYDDGSRRFNFAMCDERSIKEFLKRKVYWLGFREGIATTQAWIADPYDAQYLGTTQQRLKQLAQLLAAQGFIHVDSTGDFAFCSEQLLKDADIFEQELSAKLQGTVTRLEHPVGVRDGSTPSAFISYSSHDRGFAQKLAQDLKARNLGVWFDQWEIKVGDSLITKIGKGIRENDFLIVVLSAKSVQSEWVKKELNEAMQKEIREKRVVVLPVLLEACELPPFLSDKRHADFSKNYEAALEELVEAIRSHHRDLAKTNT